MQQTLNNPPTSLIQESQVSVVAALETSASLSWGRTQAGFPKPHNSTQLVKRIGPCDVRRLVLGAPGDKKKRVPALSALCMHTQTLALSLAFTGA